jgi:hypothetical protein
MATPNPLNTQTPSTKDRQMSETAESRLDIHHPDIVTAFASAWASIDGKLPDFIRESGGSVHPNDPTYTGHYEGYMFEAADLLNRAGSRLRDRLDLWDVLSKAVEAHPLTPKDTET